MMQYNKEKEKGKEKETKPKSSKFSFLKKVFGSKQEEEPVEYHKRYK